MSPSRTPYRAPKARREVFLAVLGVLGVLVFTGVMLWVLAPESEEPTTPVPPITTPASLPTDSLPTDSTPASSTPPSAPGDSTATTAPVTSSSAPGG